MAANATTIGTIQLIASIDTSQYEAGGRRIEKTNTDIEKSASSTERKANNSFNGIAKVGLAAVAAAAIAAGAVIVKNLGNAVSRVDTLNNFPKVMGNLGYGADEASAAINKLDQGVRGLPTSLDQIASAMQNIAPATKNLDSATELTLAFNNALVAGGKSAAYQATAMEQFSQAIAKGRPDMMEWRTLASTMPGQLKQISNSLGYENWQKMADAVTEGELSFNDVLTAIVKLNKEGLGQFPSFAEQARNATGGLQTSATNMATAITRGLGRILEAIGTDNIANALKSIGRAFEAVFSIVAYGINFIQGTGQVFLPIINGVGALVGTFILLTTAIYVGVKAFAALRVAMTLVAAHPVVLVLSIIVGLIAAIATASGMKDFNKGLNDSDKSAEGLAGGLGSAADNLGGATKEATKLAKELAKIDKEVAKTNESFREQLAELVFNKRQSIKELNTQLEEERTAYNKSYSDRLRDFNESQYEEQKSHDEKTARLTSQISFLQKYQNQSNKQQLSDLQFSLARENALYAKQTTERKTKYDQDAENERLSYEKRQAELQAKLDSETSLLEKHRLDVDSIRDVMLLDEIQKLKRSRDEQLSNLNQQRNDAITSAAETAGGVASAWSNPTVMTDFANAGNTVGTEMGKAMVNAVITELKNLPKKVWDESKPGGAIDRMFKSLFGWAGGSKPASGSGWATGGFTGRGGVNEPAGLVHRGEYVLPQTAVDQTTGLPDLDKLIGNMNNQTSVTNVTVSLSHSKGAMRQAALDTIELVNEVYRSRGMPQIGVKA